MTRDRRAILIAGLAAGVPASVIGNTDASPASVGCDLRVVRLINGTPTPASSEARDRPTDCSERCRWRAAAL